MKAFIKNNTIHAAIVAVSVMMVLTVMFAFYNRQMLGQYNTVTRQSTNMKGAVVSVLEVGLGNLDKDLRAFLLTKEQAYLMRIYKYMRKDIDSIYVTCENSFAEQKTVFPQTQPKVDSFSVQLEQIKRSLTEYYTFCDQLITLAQQDSLTQIRTLLAQDRGMQPWSLWNQLNLEVQAYEDGLVQETQAKYETSIFLLNWMLALLLVMGLPTLIWIFLKLRSDREKRVRLLKALEENNRKFLFDADVSIHTEDEKVVIENSMELLQKAALFVRQIGEGNYTIQWEGLTEQNKKLNQGSLAGELVNMREQLIKIKQEDAHRNWTNEGLGLISNLLQSNLDLQQLTDQVLSSLIKYLSVNQGALFVVNDHEGNQPWLELVSAYAYGRKKYVDKQIQPGQGLAGQAWLEAETIYLEKVPHDYVQITSGLGEATPGAVLIVPLKNEDTVLGILEIASFQRFERHQIDFVEKVAGSIASVVASIKINEKTRYLLTQTQKQAEEMRAQEEEMRQNMEEMQATQEEMYRKEQEYLTEIAQLKRQFAGNK